MKELRIEAAKRAIKYEEVAWRSSKKLVIKCIEEIRKEKRTGEESKWEKGSREMIEKTGLSKEEMNEAARLVKIMMERVENKEKEMTRIKIDSSKYNGIYKTIRIEEILGYLKERKGKKERSTIARFRCGNKARGSQEWEEEEQRKCRVCRREREKA